MECERCGICLNNVEIFKNFSEVEQRIIMDRAEHRLVEKKSVLFSPEDFGDGLIIVKEGKLKLSNYDENGKEYIYDIITTGNSFGEEFILYRSRYGYYGEALTDLDICFLTRDSLQEVLYENPDLSLKIIEYLGKKFVEQKNMIKILNITDSKQRICQYLLYRAEYTGSYTIELSRETIASAVNMSRETVSRKLVELEKEGKIELEGYKKIIIKQKEQMLLNS